MRALSEKIQEEANDPAPRVLLKRAELVAWAEEARDMERRIALLGAAVREAHKIAAMIVEP